MTEDEMLNRWEHSEGVIEVLTSYPMGAWLHRRDGRVINEILNKIRAEIDEEKIKGFAARNGGLEIALNIIDKYRSESEDK